MMSNIDYSKWDKLARDLTDSGEGSDSGSGSGSGSGSVDGSGQRNSQELGIEISGAAMLGALDRYDSNSRFGVEKLKDGHEIAQFLKSQQNRQQSHEGERKMSERLSKEYAIDYSKWTRLASVTSDSDASSTMTEELAHEIEEEEEEEYPYMYQSENGDIDPAVMDASDLNENSRSILNEETVKADIHANGGSKNGRIHPGREVDGSSTVENGHGHSNEVNDEDTNGAATRKFVPGVPAEQAPASSSKKKKRDKKKKRRKKGDTVTAEENSGDDRILNQDSTNDSVATGPIPRFPGSIPVFQREIKNLADMKVVTDLMAKAMGWTTASLKSSKIGSGYSADNLPVDLLRRIGGGNAAPVNGSIIKRKRITGPLSTATSSMAIKEALRYRERKDESKTDASDDENDDLRDHVYIDVQSSTSTPNISTVRMSTSPKIITDRAEEIKTNLHKTPVKYPVNSSMSWSIQTCSDGIKSESRPILSPNHVDAAGCKWRFIYYTPFFDLSGPKSEGSKASSKRASSALVSKAQQLCNQWVSVYISVPNVDELPFGWSRRATFTVSLMNKSQPSKNYHRTDSHVFKAIGNEMTWGWRYFINLEKAKKNGVLENDQIDLMADISLESESTKIDNADLAGYLARACKTGNIENAETCLDTRQSVISERYQGNTALHSLCMSSETATHVDLLKILLKRGAEVNAVNEENETSLLLASYYGNLKLVQELLAHEASAKIGPSKNGLCALGAAAQQGRLAIVKELIKADAPVDGLGNGCCSPLKEALCLRRWKCAKRLVQAGCSLASSTKPSKFVAGEVKPKGTDAELDENYLAYAAHHGPPDLILSMLKRGADPNTMDTSGECVLSILLFQRKLTVIAYVLWSEYHASLELMSRKKAKEAARALVPLAEAELKNFDDGKFIDIDEEEADEDNEGFELYPGEDDADAKGENRPSSNKDVTIEHFPENEEEDSEGVKMIDEEDGEADEESSKATKPKSEIETSGSNKQDQLNDMNAPPELVGLDESIKSLGSLTLEQGLKLLAKGQYIPKKQDGKGKDAVSSPQAIEKDKSDKCSPSHRWRAVERDDIGPGFFDRDGTDDELLERIRLSQRIQRKIRKLPIQIARDTRLFDELLTSSASIAELSGSTHGKQNRTSKEAKLIGESTKSTVKHTPQHSNASSMGTNDDGSNFDDELSAPKSFEQEHQVSFTAAANLMKDCLRNGSNKKTGTLDETGMQGSEELSENQLGELGELGVDPRAFQHIAHEFLNERLHKIIRAEETARQLVEEEQAEEEQRRRKANKKKKKKDKKKAVKQAKKAEEEDAKQQAEEQERRRQIEKERELEAKREARRVEEEEKQRQEQAERQRREDFQEAERNRQEKEQQEKLRLEREREREILEEKEKQRETHHKPPQKPSQTRTSTVSNQPQAGRRPHVPDHGTRNGSNISLSTATPLAQKANEQQWRKQPFKGKITDVVDNGKDGYVLINYRIKCTRSIIERCNETWPPREGQFVRVFAVQEPGSSTWNAVQYSTRSTGNHAPSHGQGHPPRSRPHTNRTMSEDEMRSAAVTFRDIILQLHKGVLLYSDHAIAQVLQSATPRDRNRIESALLASNGLRGFIELFPEIVRFENTPNGFAIRAIQSGRTGGNHNSSTSLKAELSEQAAYQPSSMNRMAQEPQMHKQPLQTNAANLSNSRPAVAASMAEIVPDRATTAVNNSRENSSVLPSQRTVDTVSQFAGFVAPPEHSTASRTDQSVFPAQPGVGNESGLGMGRSRLSVFQSLYGEHANELDSLFPAGPHLTPRSSESVPDVVSNLLSGVTLHETPPSSSVSATQWSPFGSSHPSYWQTGEDDDEPLQPPPGLGGHAMMRTNPEPVQQQDAFSSFGNASFPPGTSIPPLFSTSSDPSPSLGPMIHSSAPTDFDRLETMSSHAHHHQSHPFEDYLSSRSQMPHQGHLQQNTPPFSSFAASPAQMMGNGSSNYGLAWSSVDALHISDATSNNDNSNGGGWP